MNISEQERIRQRERAHEVMDKLCHDDLLLVRRMMDRLVPDDNRVVEDEVVVEEVLDNEQPHEESAISAFLKRRKQV